jgi:purine-binding chemotaxis protein CheW
MGQKTGFGLSGLFLRRFEMSISDALTASDLATAAAQQIVTFKVEGRSFGVPVGAVRENKGWQPTTPLPNSARHVLGVINLRGAIIAVYDLRQRLGLGPSSISRASVVVVIDLGVRFAGILVDAVSDIIDIKPQDLRPAPETACDGDDVLQGLLVRGDEVVSLLDLASLVREPSSMNLAA